MKKCRMCQASIKGRSDKVFCTVKCKTSYHSKLRQVTRDASYSIDQILHRNRSILLEVMGKHKTQIKVPRLLLEKKKFNFTYITKYYINSKGKTYHFVYDFSYLTFHDGQVLIYRKRE